MSIDLRNLRQEGWPDAADEIERLQASHDEYVVRANANVCELNRKVERLTAALDEITKIEDDLYGSDWAEIEKARNIAFAALADGTQPPVVANEQKPDYAQELVDQAQELNLGYGQSEK